MHKIRKESIRWQRKIHTMQTVFRSWKDWKRYESVRECISEVCLRKGLNHLIYEIVDNAVDEHLAGFCTEIHVTLEKDGSATVEDNGRGIPVGMHAKGSVGSTTCIYDTACRR